MRILNLSKKTIVAATVILSILIVAVYFVYKNQRMGTTGFTERDEIDEISSEPKVIQEVSLSNGKTVKVSAPKSLGPVSSSLLERYLKK